MTASEQKLSRTLILNGGPSTTSDGQTTGVSSEGHGHIYDNAAEKPPTSIFKASIDYYNSCHSVESDIMPNLILVSTIIVRITLWLAACG